MRLPRLRFTVRRLMVAVAILGLIAGFEMGRRRRIILLEEANLHAMEERMNRSLSDAYKSNAESFRAHSVKSRMEAAASTDGVSKEFHQQIAINSDEIANESDRIKEAYLLIAKYHETLNQKYSKASIFPWLSVTPDQPKPPEPPELVDDLFRDVSIKPMELPKPE